MVLRCKATENKEFWSMDMQTKYVWPLGGFDSLVIWQACDVERLCGTRGQGDRIHLLLGHEGSAMCLVDIQAEGGGETVRNHERQILKSLQLTGLLVADLQPDSVVSLFQL